MFLPNCEAHHNKETKQMRCKRDHLQYPNISKRRPGNMASYTDTNKPMQEGDTISVFGGFRKSFIQSLAFLLKVESRKIIVRTEQRCLVSGIESIKARVILRPTSENSLGNEISKYTPNNNLIGELNHKKKYCNLD